jgi:hypothetical protein
VSRERDDERTEASDAAAPAFSDSATPPTWWTSIVDSSDADEAPDESDPADADGAGDATQAIAVHDVPTPKSERLGSTPAAAQAPDAGGDETQALAVHDVPTPKAERLANQAPPPPLAQHRIPWSGPVPVVGAAAGAAAASAGADDDATQALPAHQLPKPKLHRTPTLSPATPASASIPTPGSAPTAGATRTLAATSWSLLADGTPSGPIPVFDGPHEAVAFTASGVGAISTRSRSGAGGADAAAGSVAVPAPRTGRPPLTRSEKILGLVAASLVGVIALIGLFIAGTRIAPVEVIPVPVPTVTALPAPVPDDELTAAPVDPGTHAWNELVGGECLEPYDGPWAEEFTVVECDTAHAAQMVVRGALLDDDDPAEFPGVEALQSQVSVLCDVPGAIDLEVASAYRDLQIEASYPVTAEEWDSGYRDFYCFATRSSGEALDVSVAGGE